MVEEYSAFAEFSPTINVHPGEFVQLTTSSGDVKSIKILGIYHIKASQFASKSFIDKEVAKTFFNLDDSFFEKSNKIMIHSFQGVDNKKLTNKINHLMIDGKAYYWQDRLGPIQDMTSSFLIISTFTKTIGIIISFAIIFIMIYINVLQKKSQIGIMKATGINKNTILFSYVLQSSFYGIVGSILGTFLLSLMNMHFSSNPIDFPIADVFMMTPISTYIISSSMLIGSSLIAGYFASRGVIKQPILSSIFEG